MSENLYTSSRLRVFRECARKHFYRFVLRAITPSTPAMAFGTHAHKALEHWYRAWMLGRPELRLVDALEYIDSVVDISEVDRIRLRVLVIAYDARWGGEDWEILGVEIEFRYWLGDVELGGKIDALIRDRKTGRVWVVEHKTSTADTSVGAPYWQRLTVDTQVSIYIDGAAYGLDYQIAGCIYDVLKRPQHELKLATPEASRKYTEGTGCSKCGGCGKAGAIEKGRGFYIVSFPPEPDKHIACEGCAGTGWKLDKKKNKPDAPHLYANQRAEDETLDEFEERIANEIADRVDDFLSRGTVVRLDSELPRMRQELLDTVAAMRALDALDIAPPNHDACVKGRDMCSFFIACSGQASIDDEYTFPRGVAHPELAAA